ncbi:SDR family NAD(P)-dependent oxidoreductase [Pseudoalteromonas xiamenensis]|uniref:SDR family NAD(P)-dependent oxidoreductase n=1 Tax=Pseudoalteromonas xiamenensis TaxID=882626 RepID=UPI0027E5466A|nr:SDR family NAD(P)-dependent oxidoreductase [Pseudoalteromonas xiamenensis]WMN60099.1 SDR family NAD(P)-dependent oxidoreductase [Pseudoalteromonas xiamenensis]
MRKDINTPLKVLITGCSSGIGLFCTQQLHNEGHHVVATVRNQEDKTRLEALGLNVAILDLASPKSREAGFNTAIELLEGRLDILFNNGAYGQPGAVEDLPTDVLKQQFEVNLFAWHDLTIRAIRLMHQQGNGKIVHNSSVLGLVALPYRGAYNSSKFALEGLTDTLRMELSGTNIHISLIEPGPIVSKFRENAKKAFLENIDWKSSRHKTEYDSQINRLSASDAPQKFTLGPEAVYERLDAIIKSEKPKARYYVTFPTYLMGFLKRILTSAQLDKVLLKNR